MTDDDLNTLRRIFPGDPVPDGDDGVCWVQRETTSRGPRLAAYTPQPPPVAQPRLLPEFERVMSRATPSAPSAPARQYLIESPANVARWLEEAREIESDVTLGQDVEKHQVTRLLLEAIPVVQTFARQD